MADPRDREFIAQANAPLKAGLDAEYSLLGEALDRRGIAIDEVVRAVSAFGVALPSWGVGTGGTRFARFPGPGEPRDIYEKLEDCGTIFKLVRSTPAVSLHI